MGWFSNFLQYTYLQYMATYFELWQYSVKPFFSRQHCCLTASYKDILQQQDILGLLDLAVLIMHKWLVIGWLEFYHTTSSSWTSRFYLPVAHWLSLHHSYFAIFCWLTGKFDIWQLCLVLHARQAESLRCRTEMSSWQCHHFLHHRYPQYMMHYVAKNAINMCKNCDQLQNLKTYTTYNLK